MPKSPSTSPYALGGRRRVRVSRIFALVGVVFLCSTACSVDTSAPGPTAPIPTESVPTAPVPTEPEPADPSVVDVITIDLRPGSGSLTDSLSSTTTEKSLDEATTRLVTKVPVLAETVTLRYTVLMPESAAVTTLPDGSVAISDGQVFLAGFVNVDGGFTDVNLGNTRSPWIDITPKHSATGDRWRSELTTPGRLVLSQEIAPAATDSTKQRRAAAVFGTDLIAGVQWSHLEGGKSLMVSATILGRIIGEADVELLHAELIREVPKADTTVMAKQLRCHAEFAPAKTTWNLEPWRPDVSYLEYLAARCNPVDR